MKTILRFEVPTPSSTKNSRQLFMRKNGRPGSIPGARGRRSKLEVRRAALAAVEAMVEEQLQGLEPELLGCEDDIGVEIEIDVPGRVARVAVYRLGPKPKGLTGRGKDVDNIASTILDGINKIAYGDDRQVAMLQVKRTYG